MRRMPALALLSLLLAAGCAGGKPATRQRVRSRFVEADSFRAVLADDLQVRLHEVVILPVDSPRVRVEIKEVELQRERVGEVQSGSLQTAASEADAEATPAPARGRNPLEWLLFGFVVGLMVKLWWRSRR